MKIFDLVACFTPPAALVSFNQRNISRFSSGQLPIISDNFADCFLACFSYTLDTSFLLALNPSVRVRSSAIAFAHKRFASALLALKVYIESFFQLRISRIIRFFHLSKHLFVCVLKRLVLESFAFTNTYQAFKQRHLS